MIDCVILCGGKSSRMGTPKESLRFANQTLAQYQYNKLSYFFDKVFFCAKKPIESFETILDCTKELFAPIFGLKSTLETRKKDTFILAIDTPFLAYGSLEALINAYQKSHKSTFAKNTKIHPLIGIYAYETLDKINQQISQNDYKLMRLLNLIPTDFIAIPEEQTRNLNTPQDYQEILKEL